MIGALLAPLQPALEWVASWSDQAGPLAMFFYVGLFVGTAVLLMPTATVLIGLAGFTFGFLPALLLTALANLLSCWIQWHLGSGVLRRWVQGRERFGPALEMVDSAIQRDAFKIVLLARFSLVVPFGILNMACGAARVPVGAYVSASAIGLAPAAMAFVYLGTLADDAADILAGPTSAQARIAQLVGLTLGGLSTLLLLWWGGRVARSVLSRNKTCEKEEEFFGVLTHII